MRVLVTGSRQVTEQAIVYDALNKVYQGWKATREPSEAFIIIHGSAPGADTLANQWAWDMRQHGVVVEVHPADWRKGPYAGHQRNFEMVNAGADLVIAFYQTGARNAGTMNCVDVAKRLLGIKVKAIEEIWAP